MYQRLSQLGRQIGLALAVGALILLGLLAVASAPRQSSASGNSNGQAPLSQSRHLAGAGTTPVATDTPIDTPTVDPLATATDTPVPPPTDTPVPPTATPTPPPAWHVLTIFSGDGAQDLGTISPAYPWRLRYTCAYTGVAQSFLVPYVRDGRTDYTSVGCDAGDQSGLVADGVGWPAPAGTYALSIMGGGYTGYPQYTITVEVWY